MPKPKTFDGYDEDHTLDCERVLVTLLRGLGPWKDSVYLIGGLTCPSGRLRRSYSCGMMKRSGRVPAEHQIWCVNEKAI